MKTLSNIDRLSRRQRSRGFTLIEVLIVTSLLALLSIIVLMGMRFSFEMWKRSNDASAAMDEVAFAQQFLRQTLESAYPRLNSAESGVSAVDFTGNATQVSFLGTPFQSAFLIGRTRITVSAVESDGGFHLVTGLDTSPHFGADNKYATEETLIANVKDIKFSFLPHGESEWREEWTGETRLPSLIRIEVAMPDGDKRAWPVMIVAPRVDVDATCRYDPLTKYCLGRGR